MINMLGYFEIYHSVVICYEDLDLIIKYESLLITCFLYMSNIQSLVLQCLRITCSLGQVQFLFK